MPDYGTYLAQLKTNIDGIFLGFAGSNGFRYVRQFNEYGLNGKINVVGGMTALDEAVLRNMGDEALGILTACWYSAELDNPINRKFAPAFRAEAKYDPGFYAAATYTDGAVLEAALKAVKGKIEDKAGVHEGAARHQGRHRAAGRSRSTSTATSSATSTSARSSARKAGWSTRSIHTYPNVSQFWTYKPKEFLKNPVYSRDWPPAKNLES